MTLLENFWYGSIHPVEEYLEGNKEYINLLRIVAKIKKRLTTLRLIMKIRFVF